MATTVAATSGTIERPKQNWVVGPWSDMVFIIGAPIVAFVFFAPIFYWFGLTTIWLIFIGANLGHHVPTFMRIYGDKNLVERFRWNLLLAPVIPFCLAMFAVSYLILNGYDVGTVMLILLVLSIWDPWHFLMQNHGFMRIYDRHNKAPRKLAGRMDLALGATWFIYIMVEAVNWLPDLLLRIHLDTGIPVLSLINSTVFRSIELTSFVAMAAMSLAYVGYICWSYQRGYYVSYAKLLFFAVLNGVMWLTYVPNPIIRILLPNWSFSAGFATLGMVHITQYLAIVWKYNRSLAIRGKNVRPGSFQKLFMRGGVLVVLLYTALCLSYGYGLLHLKDVGIQSLLTQERAQQRTQERAQQRTQERAQQGEIVREEPAGTWQSWMLGTALAVIFTSTITHYYYDGFIWKVRHKENRQNLAMQDETDTVVPARTQWASWGGSETVTPPLKMLLKQGLYFGLPISLVIVTGLMVRNDPVKNPRAIAEHIERAEKLGKSGKFEQAQEEIVAAIIACDRLLKIELQMIEIRPTPSHYSLISDLTYRRSRFEYRRSRYLNRFVEPHKIKDTEMELLRANRSGLLQAIDYQQKALELPDELGKFEHMYNDGLTRKGAEKRILQIQAEIAGLDARLKVIKGSSI